MMLAASQTGDILRLDTGSYYAFGLAVTANAKWKLDNDGGVYVSRTHISGGAWIWLYNWVTPTSSAADYECSWTAGTGTVDTTPVAEGSYAALTSDREWIESNPGPGSGEETASFTARLRKVGAGSDAKTAVITLRAEYDTGL